MRKDKQWGGRHTNADKDRGNGGNNSGGGKAAGVDILGMAGNGEAGAGPKIRNRDGKTGNWTSFRVKYFYVITNQ